MASSARMPILVESEICFSEMPRLRRTVAKPSTLLSSVICQPVYGSPAENPLAGIEEYTITLLIPLINSFFMGICRREFVAGILGAVAARHLFTMGKKAEPYHGYYYRVLTSQGPDAAGGAFDYVVNGKMVKRRFRSNCLACGVWRIRSRDLYHQSRWSGLRKRPGGPRRPCKPDR